MKKLKLLSQALALSLVVVLISACTKKRDAALPYGEDRDLQTVSIFEGKEFDLQTFEAIKSSSSSGKVKVSDERASVHAKTRNFDYVRYQSKDPLKLTDDTLMLGLPNHLYKVKYLFQGDLLKVMKLASADELSKDEQAAAIDNKDGRLMVPIVSYKIKFYSIGQKRDEHDDKTSKLELIELQGGSGASHFKIDYNTKTRASFLSKATVLPANFFEGEKGESKDWYYAVTVVRANTRGEYSEWQGIDIHSDKFGRDATKVRARKLENKIVFFNLGIDEGLEKTVDKRVENQALAASIPIDLVDYQFEDAGKTSSVKEAALKEKAWEQRAYADLKISEISIPGGDIQINEITDVQIADGYFSFTAKSEAIDGLIRFSFYNVKSYQKDSETKFGAKSYQPKIYFPEDQKLFGYFSRYKEGVSSFENTRQEGFEKRNFLTRFNPTRQVIEYRLNHEAPEWTEEIAKKAVNGWNATFQAAGSPIRIRIADESGKVLRGYPGDLRYNLINFLTEADSTNVHWLGLGPSISDPLTGEIIMATANVNVGMSQKMYQGFLTSYLASIKGDLDQKYVLGFSLPGLKAIKNMTEKSLQMSGSFLGLESGVQMKQLAIYDSQNRNFKDVYKIQGDKNLLKQGFSRRTGFESRVESVHPDIVEAALKACPALKKYSEEIKNRKDLAPDLEQERQVIHGCATILVEADLISTVVHEMGHNFGLTHNFAGSADPQNYFSEIPIKLGAVETKVQWKSSSVMDYTDLNLFNMTQPGRYDIAAIRWGYQDQVESKQGQMIAAPPAQATRTKLDSQMRNFRFCSDVHISLIADDPFCGRFDSGYDPESVVTSLINNYELSISLRNNRMGRALLFDMTDLALSRYERYLEQMLKFYEGWRVILEKEAGYGEQYLESYDTKEKYDALVQRVLDVGRQGKDKAALNEKYYKASQKIFAFLTRMAFMPDYSCITKRTVNDKETYQLFSLSTIQAALHSPNKSSVQDCSDKDVRQYLLETRGATVIGEGGLPFDNVYKETASGQIDPISRRRFDNPERVGIAQDRYIAMQLLTGRSSILIGNQRGYFQPGFMDELPFRDALHRKVIDRLTKGIELNELMIQEKLQIPGGSLMHSLNFTTEAPLLSHFWSLFKRGLEIPGKMPISNLRREKYSVTPHYLLNDREGVECLTYLNQAGHSESYCALKESTAALTLVKQLKSINKRRSAWKVTQETLNTFWDIASPMIPETGKGAEADIVFWDKLIDALDAWRDNEKKTNPDKAAQIYEDMQQLLFVFEKEVKLFKVGMGKAIEKLKREDLPKEKFDAEAFLLKQKTLASLAIKTGDKDYKGLDRQILETRINEMATKIESDYETHKADIPEWEAQADILMYSLFSRE